MNAIADPYPEHLAELDPEPIVVNQDAVTNRLITAINRLAQAIEQDTLARLHPVGPQPAQNAPQAAAPVLTPLPPVQTVTAKPPCPKHGPDKVQPSTKFTGFFCTAKDTTGPRGYCSWQARQ